MLKVLILFNHLQIGDGVARSAIGIANALAERGCKVTLRPLVRYDVNMQNRLDPNVIVKPVFKRYFKGFSFLVNLTSKKFLYRCLVNGQYDIEVGLCMVLPIRIVAAYSNRNNKVLRFAWMHCYDNDLSLLKEYQRIGKVICVSKYNADKLLKEAEGRFDVDFAYNLLDNKQIESMGKQKVDIDKGSEILFVSVGRMSPEKGYLRLLEISKRLLDEGYSFFLWLIGDGPQKKKLEARANELRIRDNVYFFGEQINPHAYTAKADIFVCSSFDEGYSTACTEAVILGVPVLTTNVSGGREIIEEAEAGSLVGTGDEELYLGMREILDHPELIKSWKQKLKITKEKFSYESRAEKLYEIFNC